MCPYLFELLGVAMKKKSGKRGRSELGEYKREAGDS